MIIAQECLRLATIKGHSKMCSFITQHNATDVARFEGACNWHADCRNVHQTCCMWIECSFLYHKPSPKAFQRIWQYIQPASQLQTADIDYLNLLYCLKKIYFPAAVIVFTHIISACTFDNIHRYILVLTQLLLFVQGPESSG